MKKLGWFPNRTDRRDYDIDKLSLSQTSGGTTLEGHIDDVYDQESTSSCVAQAMAQAIAIRENIVKGASTPVSRLFLYYRSRGYHSGNYMVDDGTYIRLCAKGWQYHGVPDEKYMPFSSYGKIVNKMPGWYPASMAYGRKGGKYYWILDGGYQRVQAIRAALADDYPVVFGTKVTEAFTENNGSFFEDEPRASETIGGHAMLIVGYHDDSQTFRVVNSWGDDWRDGGFISLTEDYICSKLSRDFCILKP